MDMLSPEKFLEQLAKGMPMSKVTVVGMAKKSDDDPNSIMFVEGTNCSGWVTIPLSQIEGVEVLGEAPCKDHAHPLVRLHLKRPDSEAGAFFADLVAKRTIVPARVSPMPTGTPAFSPMSLAAPNRMLRAMQPLGSFSVRDCSCSYFGCGSCPHPFGGDGFLVRCFCGDDPNPHERCDGPC